MSTPTDKRATHRAVMHFAAAVTVIVRTPDLDDAEFTSRVRTAYGDFVREAPIIAQALDAAEQVLGLRRG